jgi:hypothetical protein
VLVLWRLLWGPVGDDDRAMEDSVAIRGSPDARGCEFIRPYRRDTARANELWLAGQRAMPGWALQLLELLNLSFVILNSPHRLLKNLDKIVHRRWFGVPSPDKNNFKLLLRAV